MAVSSVKLKMGIILGLLILIPLTTLIIIYSKRGRDWFIAKFLMMFIPNSMIGSSTIYFQLEKTPALKLHKIISDDKFEKKILILKVLLGTWIYESLIISILNSMVPISLSNHTRFFFWGLQLLSLIHTVKLFQCQLPSPLYRFFLSFPYAVTFTGAILIFPFLLPLSLFALDSKYILIFLIAPFVIAIFLLYLTMKTRSAKNYEIVNVSLHDRVPVVPQLKRVSQRSANKNDEKEPLRVVQLTDVHIGAMMSVSRLRYICEQVVKIKPDLVLLTGDFFTIEAYGGGYGVPSNSTAIIESLSPLLSLPGRCFACLGNHDKEDVAGTILRDGLTKLSITLLVDAEEIIDTQNGKVQLIGLDYRHYDRYNHVNSTLAKFPRSPDVDYRLIMLHDPGAFKYIDAKDGSLVFSGHTHGGQVGWMYGFHISLMDVIEIPDNGLWGWGKNRLYVHRGQGSRSLFSNCITRIGIPNEESVLLLIS